MKILLISTVKTGKDGITNVIFNYLRAIDTNQIEFNYLSINQPELSYINELEKRKCKLYVVPRSGLKIISYIMQLRHIIASNKYDVVHIHTNSHTVVLELLAAKMGGCKKRIVHSHNTTCNSVSIHRLLTPLFNALYTDAFACGKEAGRWMFNERPFLVINNGVDTNLYAFKGEVRSIVRKKLGIQENEILLGHVGAFNEAKNQEFLIRIFHVLYNRHPEYKLLLIGDGFLRTRIERQVIDYKLSSNVIFSGNIDNVYDYLNAIDLIIMPSLFEGLPLTLIEQQANGLHCIVANTITKEADKTGNLKFVSLQESYEHWANVIEDYPKEKDRTTTSQQAILKIKEKGYSIQEEAQKLTNYYHSVKDSASKRPYLIQY